MINNMKTNELMMNDWVYRSEMHGDDVGRPYPVQIHLIEDWTHQGKEHVADVGCDDDDELSINSIKPIPLTKDILLKNGFERTGSFADLKEYMLTDVDTDIYIFYVECSEPYFYTEIATVEVKIEYVHQLQHLLRMCGSATLADNLKI